MLIFPAIDLYEGKAVRLLQGDYRKMTIYSNNPIELVRDFEAQGASCLHVVDLEGAKSGTTPNLELIRSLKAETSLFTEVGGGIRTLICTEISKDGAMQGTNHELYRTLSEQLSMQIVASGGVSSLDDVKKLAALNLYGAIIGKAYYTGAIQLKEAIEIAAGENKTLD